MSDVARDYLTKAIDLLEEDSVDGGHVDWPALRAAAFRSAVSAQTTADTYDAIRYVIFHLHDRHTFLIPPAPALPDTVSPGSPTGRTLPGGIALLALPGTNGATDGDVYARTGAAEVRTLDRADPCGWIVDLREDTGGSIVPMLVMLAPLISGPTIGYFVDRHGTRTRITVEDGRLFGDGVAYQGTTVSNPYRLHRPHPPVAVLIGHDTASAGEFTLIAFVGQPGVRTFGQPTLGLASGNFGVTLSDGALLVITNANDVDRTGHVYPNQEAVQPDVPTAVGDATVTAATDWLAGTPECRNSR